MKLSEACQKLMEQYDKYVVNFKFFLIEKINSFYVDFFLLPT